MDLSNLHPERAKLRTFLSTDRQRAQQIFASLRGDYGSETVNDLRFWGFGFAGLSLPGDHLWANPNQALSKYYASYFITTPNLLKERQGEDTISYWMSNIWQTSFDPSDVYPTTQPPVVVGAGPPLPKATVEDINYTMKIR